MERTDSRPPGAAADFDDFYTREYRALVRFAYALSGSALAAEDLAQEALVRAHRDWPKIRDYDRPAAWVRRVCINLARSAHRRREAERRALERLGRQGTELTVQPIEGDDGAFWGEVRRLPRRQPEIVVLHYVEDRSADDIAAVVGLSPSSVRVELHRARRRLAERLHEEYNDDDR